MATDAGVLVIFAHPAFERARVAPAMARAARDVSGVTFRDLYELYPDLTVDVEAEQQALVAARTLVLQFPLYWYAAPSLMKEWQDLVLSAGFAYGPNCRGLKGKTMACAVSAAGRDSLFHARGKGLTAEEVIRPYAGIAAVCGMRWGEPFVVQDAPLLDDPAIEAAAQRYRAYLERLAR